MVSGEYRRNTTPDDLAVDLQAVKSDLRLDGDEFDETLRSHILTATEELESDCRRQLLETDFTLYLDKFPTAGCGDERAIRDILIEVCPVVSIDEIRYLDAAGVQQVLSTSHYRTDLISEPARVSPAYGLAWPVSQHVSHAVEIDFTAGFATAADIPEQAKCAIRARVRELFEGCGMAGEGSSVEALKQRLKWGDAWR